MNNKLLPGFDKNDKTESEGRNRYDLDEMPEMRRDLNKAPVGNTESGGFDGLVVFVWRLTISVELCRLLWRYLLLELFDSSTRTRLAQGALLRRKVAIAPMKTRMC